jgi:hypothetical protein
MEKQPGATLPSIDFKGAAIHYHPIYILFYCQNCIVFHATILYLICPHLLINILFEDNKISDAMRPNYENMSIFQFNTIANATSLRKSHFKDKKKNSQKERNICRNIVIFSSLKSQKS